MEKRLAQGESVPSFVFQKSLLQTQIFRKISNEALYQNKRDLIKRTKKKKHPKYIWGAGGVGIV